MRLLATPLWWRAAGPPLALLVAATASGTLALHILVPALPLAARDLGVSDGAIQQTITQYVIGLALGQLVYGPLSDRFGRRPVLLAGLLLYTLGGIGAWLAADVRLLVAARVMQALGGCSGLVLGRAILRDLAEPKQAAARLALLNLVVSVGPALAPLAGGYIAVLLGWRAVMALMAAAGGVTLLAALLTLPETAASRGGGALRSMLRGYGSLLRSPTFRGYAIGGACTTTSFYAYITASPFIFVDLLHRPTEEVGLYYLVVFSGVSLGSLLANRLVRRVRPALLLRGASAVAMLGAAIFFAAAASGHLSVAAVLVAMLVFTVGIGTASPLALTGAISTFPRAIGAASGLYGALQMGFGALCTLAVSVSPANGALAAATVLLVSSVLGQYALTRATRRGFGVAG